MKPDAMRWSQVRCFGLALVAYVHGVSVVLSRTATTPTTKTATTRCGLADLDDVESRTVVASLVVDAVVDDLRRIRRTSSGFALYRARLTVNDVLKGRLRGPVGRPGRPVTIAAGTFARASRRSATTSTTTPLCASFDLPAVGSRYIVFLQQPSSPSNAGASSSSRPVIYRISSSPEPFSVSKLNVVRRYTRRRYARAAKVRVRPRDVTLLTGQRLRLRCRTSGRPQPSVTWYKNDRPLEPDGRVMIYSNRRGSRLRISAVTIEDTGTYQCRGQNVAGPVSSMTSRVQIHDPESTTKPHVRLCTDQSYCFNGGTCYVLVSLRRQLCECKTSFQGQRCEERAVVADIGLRPVVAKEEPALLLSL